MCCLKYEQEAYESLLRVTPRVGAAVQTPDGRGVVSEVNLLTGKLKVALDGKEEAAPGEYHRRDVRPVRGEGSRGSRQEAAASQESDEEE